MKWAGRLGALVLMLAALAAVPWAAGETMPDLKKMLKKPQPVWEGILSVAVVPSFPTVNVNGWLEAQSRIFEKGEGNVLVSVREMTQAGVYAGAAAANLPDVLLFGAGVFDQPQALFSPMRGRVAVREELKSLGCDADGTRYAVPLALGGYGLLGNRNLLDAAGWYPEMTLEETLDLVGKKGMSIACPAMPYTQPLTALQSMGSTGGAQVRSDLAHTKIWPDFALEDRYVFYVATQREVRRMLTLQKNGSEFQSVFLAPEGDAYTDQVLLGGVVRPELTAGGEKDALYRAQWAGKLFSALLGEEAQRELAQAWLFPVTEVEGIYPQGTDMAALEASLSENLTCAPVFPARAG